MTYKLLRSWIGRVLCDLPSIGTGLLFDIPVSVRWFLCLLVFGLFQYPWLQKVVHAEAVDAAPSYFPDVAPVLRKHCSSCHRENGAAPFSLLGFREVSRHAEQMVAVVESGLMPPWLPKGGNYEFAHSPSLSVAEIDRLKDWIRGGKQQGEEGDVSLPEPALKSWELGPPDLIVEMGAPYLLAAEGPGVYRNFVIPVELDRDRYVSAFEIRPGNPKVVHHAFVLQDSTGRSRQLDAKDEVVGYDGMSALGGAKSPDGHLIAWLPGRRAVVSPKEMPWTLKSGADLVLQVHMQPSGREEQVSVKVGFHFTDTPPARSPVKLSLFSAEIDIPAGEDNYIVADSFTLPVDASALAITAHAHYLARKVEALAIRPDGTTTRLLRIPDWDSNWQSVYEFSRPPFLPRGTRLEMRIQYDNSQQNLMNPNDPPRRVEYGPDATDEMAEVWIQVVPTNPSDRNRLLHSFRGKVARRIIAHGEYVLARTPSDEEAIIRCAKSLVVLNRKEEALQRMKTAVADYPDVAKLHQLLGELYLYHFDSDVAAARCYHRVLEIDPTIPAAQSHLGKIYFGMRKLHEAEKHFQLVPEDAADYAIAQAHLGVVCLGGEKFGRAVDHFERALVSDPANVEFARNLERARAIRDTQKP